MYGKTEAELDESLRAPIENGGGMARKLIDEMGNLTVLMLCDVAILGSVWHAII